jgi:hypothetical protein
MRPIPRSWEEKVIGLESELVKTDTGNLPMQPCG